MDELEKVVWHNRQHVRDIQKAPALQTAHAG